MNHLQTPIGQQLAKARENLGLSTEDVLSILRIRHQILDTIEMDRYPEQVINVFLKGHIVAYCKLLKITPQIILNQLESKGYDFPKPLTQPIEKKERKIPKYLWTLPFFALFILIVSSFPKKTEPSRSITQPYHGYQSNYESMELS